MNYKLFFCLIMLCLGGFRPMRAQLIAPPDAERVEADIERFVSEKKIKNALHSYEIWLAAHPPTAPNTHAYIREKRARLLHQLGKYEFEKADLLAWEKAVQPDLCLRLFAPNGSPEVYARLAINAHARSHRADLATYCWRYALVENDPQPSFLDTLERWKQTRRPHGVYWAASAKLRLNQARRARQNMLDSAPKLAQKTLLDIDTARQRGISAPMFPILEGYAYEMAGNPSQARQLANGFVVQHPHWPEGYQLRLLVNYFDPSESDAKALTTYELTDCAKRLGIETLR